jgi:predicted DNA-binding transcriptional regulator YafY
VNSTILQAINERRLISLDYDPGMRTIEPCAYGISSEGHFLLRAFQTSGASASGEHINWKLFRTDRIRSIRILEDRFVSPRPGYRRGDKAMVGGIYSQL